MMDMFSNLCCMFLVHVLRHPMHFIIQEICGNIRVYVQTRSILPNDNQKSKNQFYSNNLNGNSNFNSPQHALNSAYAGSINRSHARSTEFCSATLFLRYIFAISTCSFTSWAFATPAWSTSWIKPENTQAN